jgi:integrase
MIARDLPTFCSWNTDWHGKRRIRFRKGHFTTYLGGVPYSDAFMKNYHAILDGQTRKADRANHERIVPAVHKVGSKAHLALSLFLYTGQRRSDVVRMGWQHVNGNLLSVVQDKTGEFLKIPFHPKLAAALSAMPRTNLTFLLTEVGKPFAAAGFGNWFRDRCNEAGLPHCSAHGLRKACATRLANAGCTPEQIKSITGHKTLSEVARYTKATDQERNAQQALANLLKSESEHPCPTSSERLDMFQKK